MLGVQKGRKGRLGRKELPVRKAPLELKDRTVLPDRKGKRARPVLPGLKAPPGRRAVLATKASKVTKVIRVLQARAKLDPQVRQVRRVKPVPRVLRAPLVRPAWRRARPARLVRRVSVS